MVTLITICHLILSYTSGNELLNHQFDFSFY
nr:MAG TPA: hypothetical protein [Caudoviricetes sp.]